MNTKPLHPLTQVKDALLAISQDRVTPVTKIGDFYYFLSNEDIEFGNLVYTKFGSDLVPIKSYRVRYGNQHSLFQAISNPLPRGEFDTLVHTQLPGNLDLVMTVGQILKGYS
jgi:hypothetical protein